MIRVAKLTLESNESFHHACQELHDGTGQHILIVGIAGSFEYYGDAVRRMAGHRFAYLVKNFPLRIQPIEQAESLAEAWGICFHSDLVTSAYLRLYHRLGEERLVTFSSESVFKRFQALCEIIHHEFLDRKDFFILGNLLSTLLSMMGYEMGVDRKRGFSSQIVNSTYQRLLELVELNFRKSLTVEFYAQELCMTSRNLNLVCQSVIQQSMSEIIEARRLQEAKHLLINTDKRIHEIGAAVGYKEPAYFINVFKRRYQLTPLEFRNNIKGLLFKNFTDDDPSSSS